MQMTAGEIMESYRGAKHKRKQIQILAELNACTVEEIAEILKSQGVNIRNAIPKADTLSAPKPEPVAELKTLRERVEALLEERDRIDNELGEIGACIDELLGMMRLK